MHRDAILPCLFGILLMVHGSDLTVAQCTGSISSLDDVADAVACTTVNINSFTVTAGKSFSLSLLEGTTVNILGDISFGNKSWAGPLFQVSGDNITFNGNGHTFDGGGPFYWDGLGSNGGTTKPRPMMKVKISGTFNDLKVVNSPAQVYSVDNPGLLTMSNLIIDDSQGDLPNDSSDGLAAGHNTDGFDVGATDLVIENCTVHNQDDCLAINDGGNIVFTGNTCTGGHGVSIGSISNDTFVSGIVISNNIITDSDQALRIKTDAVATTGGVSNVTYSGNTASGLRQFGVLIDESYPSTLGAPGTGIVISDINFIGDINTITVADDAERVAVNCGVDACTGTWAWSALEVSGGGPGPINNFTGITGFTQ